MLAQVPHKTDKADLSRLVVVGDSLSAGFQNFSLLGSQQVHGYAALIASQAKVPLTLPLILPPGLPNALQLVSGGPPPVLGYAAGVLPNVPRMCPAEQATDLAVPGVTLHEAIYSRPGDPSFVAAFRDLVLGFPYPFVQPGPVRSQLEWAIALKPTTLLVWIGNNDVLLPELTGQLDAVTPLSAFTADLEELLSRLGTTNAPIVMGNIPDVTLIPYLTPVATFAGQAGIPLSVLGTVLGIDEGDYLRPAALGVAASILSGAQPGPLPALCPTDFLGLPQPSPCVLRAADGQYLRSVVQQYNNAIQDAAARHGAVLVDIKSVIDRIHADGYVVRGRRLTLDYLGGVISLDGMHPTDIGYAILANEFIHTMNSHLATGIPPIPLANLGKTETLPVECHTAPAN